MLRTFIAVRIPESPELRRLHARLSQFGESFRPVPVNNLHVTLKFLGDTDERQVNEIAAVMQQVASEHPAEVVRLIGLGAFPHERRPSVIWVGMQNAVSVTAIAAALDERLAQLGFARERGPIQPHLTMLRVKTRPPEELFSLLAESAAADFGTARIGAVELFQSELQKGGSKYTVLATAPLAIKE